MVEIDKVLAYIDSNKDKWINLLAEGVSIKSVSAYGHTRSEVVRMAEWIRNHIMRTFPHSEVMLIQHGEKEHTADGEVLDLPPIITACVGPYCPEKKTLLIYGHYDVQPAEKSDGWDTEPFILSVKEDDQTLRGRGATDDKGPLIGWLNMLESYQAVDEPFPINVKFVLEGMEESGSIGFESTVKSLAGHGGFLDNVDFCCISDNYWFNVHKPSLTHGLRGYCKAFISVSGPKADLHSGSFGGVVYEPMDDLLYILSNLKDKDTGRLAIPGIYDEVPEISAEQCKRMQDINFSVDDRKDEIGVTKLWNEDVPAVVLRNLWVWPALSVHGIEGAFAEPGVKTVIPRRVVGKVSLRTVANMTKEKTEAALKTYIERLFDDRKSCNKLDIEMQWGSWWFVDPKGRLFSAAAAATRRIHGIDPDYTCEGGSIPPALTLHEITGKDVCLLPMGRYDDGAHSQNEKLNIGNYILGMKTFAAFIDEVSRL